MTAASEASHSSPPTRAGLREVWAAFGKLGLTSFGGPVAHLGYFRSEFVTKRRWLSDADFADLVALCQFLPGPASSQMVFTATCGGLGAGVGTAVSAPQSAVASMTLEKRPMYRTLVTMWASFNASNIFKTVLPRADTGHTVLPEDSR